MDGILVIDKPPGITSHDVVSKVRRILGTRRVGHTGTLDPFATGVMVVLVGKATRLAQFLDKDEKEYLATMRFGGETDTGDTTGNFKSQISDSRSVSTEDIESALPHFKGEIMQVPPMYSAKKIDGRKLYEYARKGETIERKSIGVTISELEIVEPLREDLKSEISNLKFRVVCSAGTYIRTLAKDIGRAVGVGAHLAELRRTRAGRFELSQSVTLDELGSMDEPGSRLLPMDEAVSHLARFALSKERARRTLNGLSTRIEDMTFADGEAVRMLTDAGRLIAVGLYDEAEASIRPKVVLV
ncbi:MAG: tRNA pseudouridine(55) synthase TruB [Chloracidobacterium sp.]|nr:tRNA pseudouridine(55) synthase TruB [Chloracidobacterium sp.]